MTVSGYLFIHLEDECECKCANELCIFFLWIIAADCHFTVYCLEELIAFYSLQEDVKESLKIQEELVRNQAKVKKLKKKRKALAKDQEELEAINGKLSSEVKDLEERLAAGRQGKEVEVDVSFPDLLGDDSGIDD